MTENSIVNIQYNQYLKSPKNLNAQKKTRGKLDFAFKKLPVSENIK